MDDPANPVVKDEHAANAINRLINQHPGKLCVAPEQGSTKANGREHKSCLGQVSNFKLGCFSHVCNCVALTSMPRSRVENWAGFVQDQRRDHHCLFLSLDGIGIFNLAKIDKNIHN